MGCRSKNLKKVLDTVLILWDSLFDPEVLVSFGSTPFKLLGYNLLETESHKWFWFCSRNPFGGENHNKAPAVLNSKTF